MRAALLANSTSQRGRGSDISRLALLHVKLHELARALILGLTGTLVDPYTALILSLIISAVLALIFYQTAVKSARELLTRAETWPGVNDAFAKVRAQILKRPLPK
jgi:hypothetical protein